MYNPNGKTRAQMRTLLAQADPLPATREGLLSDLRGCQNEGRAYIHSDDLCSDLPFEVTRILDGGSDHIVVEVQAPELTALQWQALSVVTNDSGFAQKVMELYEKLYN